MPDLHSFRFPGETDSYRRARNELLQAEIDLRRQVEAVAALRRQLSVGGEVPEDYSSKKAQPISATRRPSSAHHCRNCSNPKKTRLPSTASCSDRTRKPRVPCAVP